ncbi:ClbS/DfsB family four-helix bundle protein [Clostridium sp. HV4-5-A1G]|uniref:ClbS/DfsB family four-helix bundle protein n=1 Tax=Clostridium sp. HV4-5-A1G TaxID=2004595 RepID=UPI00123C1310|nr:ClbS/DfsB family four-helix bundle protein [Clostridium sp. HV4-5-A1G]KAA8666742.1 ClbS/DfsB family four-helix bundle protein [Clostridium sp. HV4-5-A1G]CAB1261958.1 Cytoplasmic protein [Clostridiaceae bacterium BL-3]
MQEYNSKEALISEIRKTAHIFIREFNGLLESDKDLRFSEVDRTPQEIIAYQLGWTNLILKWDHDELECKEVITPAAGYRWNGLGGLYQEFYHRYQNHSLKELQKMFVDTVDHFTAWINKFSDEELFYSGGRKWASSTPSY